MEFVTYAELRNDIRCGKYDCLASCCETGQLEAVRALFSRLTASDIPTLSKLLCCRVAAHAPSQSVPGSTPQPSAPADTRDCWVRLRDYACQHEDSLIALTAVMAGVSTAFPQVSRYALAAAAILGELTADCRVDSPKDASAIAKMVHDACKLNGYLRTARDWLKSHTPDVAKDVVNTIDQTLLGMLSLDFCCPPGSGQGEVGPGLETPESAPALPASGCKGNSTSVTWSQG